MARPAPPPPALAFQDDQALMGPNRDRVLDQIKAAGGKYIRTNVIYGKVVNQQGQYDWNALDQLVNAARQRGLGVQQTLMSTPRYAPTLNQGLNYQHNDPDTWARFAAEAAKHFQGRVRRFSVGNEPNEDAFITGNARQAARTYRRFYDPSYEAIKRVNPHAFVMAGELQPGSVYPGKGNRERQALAFLRQIVAAGKTPMRADALALHPYAWRWGDPNQAHGMPTTFGGIQNLERVQDTLAELAHRGRLTTGRGGKVPLYLTEFGYSNKVTPNDARRQRYLADAYRLAGEAGAKQFLQYQIAPSKEGVWWDTSMAPAAVARATRRGRTSRATAARATARRRG